MITDVLKKIGGHTMIYAGGTLANRATSLLMIPFYTRFLAPPDYGVLELLGLTTFVIGAMVGLGLNAAIMRFYYDQPTDEGRREVISTAILFGIALLMVVYVVLFAASPLIALSVFKAQTYSGYLRIGFLSLCLDTIGDPALFPL